VLQSLRGHQNRLGLLRADGFVLRIRDFAESDLIVTLFTEQWGKRTAIAKRARRLNSRLGGVFDLLNRVEVVFYPKSRLDLVSQGALLQGFPHLKGNLNVVAAALLVGRLLDRLLPFHQPEERVYSLFGRFLNLLEAGDHSVDRLRLSVTLKLLGFLGHRPRLAGCVRCGSESGPFLFASECGGVLCRACTRREEGIKISRGLALSLDAFLRLPLERVNVIHLCLEDIRVAVKVVDGYVDHLASGP